MKSNEKGSSAGITMFAYMMGAFVVGVIPHYMGNERGRETEITACADGYDGLVEVTDLAVLGELGKTAQKAQIHDPEATFSTHDTASLPGELACNQITGGATLQTVLLPAGLDAAQRNMSGSLPNGLRWTSKESY